MSGIRTHNFPSLNRIPLPVGSPRRVQLRDHEIDLRKIPLSSIVIVSAFDRIRTDDLHCDKVANTPDCSAKACCFLSSLKFSGSRRTRTHKRLPVTCFQNRLLIQPDDFRISIFLIAEAGIEPANSRFKAADFYQQKLLRRSE